MVPDTKEMRFNVESGRLAISDPCYSKTSHGYHEIDALNGQWTGEVRFTDAGTWGIRVSSLFAAHIDYDASYEGLSKTIENGLGVDSGQMCVWDAADYDNGDARYHAIGHGDGTSPAGTLSEDRCYRGDYGVACTSGFGDGCYVAECYHLNGADSPRRRREDSVHLIRAD